MSVWRVRGRATVLFVIGLMAGLSVDVARSRADIFDPAFYQSIAAPHLVEAYHLAALAPFDLPAATASEPFRAELAPSSNNALEAKWNGVKKGMLREQAVLRHCREDESACPAAAKKFLAIVERAQGRNGWNRIAEVNRSINLSVKAVSDIEQYGKRDLWATPLMTFASNAGDCEDYAIAKYAALRELGYSDQGLRIVIVHDKVAAEDHAVVAVRYEGRWLVLDNKTLEIKEDAAIAAFNPMFMIDGAGVKKITSLAPEQKQAPWTDATAYFAPMTLSLGWQLATPTI
jgi:predicted transglutaminase-like cysteine proteinase